jgi:hypothetical protein
VSGIEILEIERNQLIVIEKAGVTVELVIGSGDLVVMEVAQQGLPGPSVESDFDIDLELLLLVAML